MIMISANYPKEGLRIQRSGVQIPPGALHFPHMNAPEINNLPIPRFCPIFCFGAESKVESFLKLLLESRKLELR
jgi:hypothetical protein